MAGQKSFFKSLRGKIVLYMLLVALIPVVVIGVLAYSSMADSRDKASTSVDESRAVLEEDVVGANLASEAKRLSVEIETEMTERVHYLQTYAASEEVTAALLAGTRTSPEAAVLNQYAYDVLDITPYWDNCVVAGPTGVGIGGAYHTFDMVTHLGIDPAYYYPLSYGGLAGDWKNGIFWTPTMTNESGVYFGSPRWIPAKIFNQPTATGIYIFSLSVRIEDAAGNITGMIIGTYGFTPTWESREYAARYTDTRLMIFGSSGQLFVDTGDWKLSEGDVWADGVLDYQDVEAISEDAEGHPITRWYVFDIEATTDVDEEKLVPVNEIPWTPAEVQVREVIAASTEARIQPESFVTEAGDYVVGYARATNGDLSAAMRIEGFAGGSGFMVMLEQPGEQAFASLTSLQNLEDDLKDNTNAALIILIAAIVIVIVLVSAIAYYLSRSITKPITQLSDAAEKVSMGELEVTLPKPSDDEIGDLSRSFDRMITSVRFLSQDEDKGKDKGA